MFSVSNGCYFLLWRRDWQDMPATLKKLSISTVKVTSIVDKIAQASNLSEELLRQTICVASARSDSMVEWTYF